MKNLFYIIFGVIICGVIISCDNQNSPQKVVEQENRISESDILEMSIIKNQLDSLNQIQFVEESHGLVRGGGWLSKIKGRIKAIVISDAVGGLVGSPLGIWGAIIGAVGFSATAAFTDK